ncbi:hypothetical protein GF1_29200 [Desulfolithobacter dissulfuricans]|uniref:Uncharacterized protein n=1 Tax=Desulfolithobacter dissulfuricans TaxID=2795293 RepID=A0A915U378_9BACT|nr:TatD family hydrolase [Desulfolithobacter dissulfuricans]BCO10544.1 hypothetical protein GF1_29200 [Desulfolithobacter dissulfuricans]
MADITIIDTHTHLGDRNFDPDREEVLARAATKGVQAVIAVSETIEDALRNLELAGSHPMILPAAGLYPGCVSLEACDQMTALIRAAADRLVAIGEVGLDYRLAKEDEERRLQRQVFAAFIHLARELDLPLNIHSRSAGRHVVAMLLDEKAEKVHLHAFDGKWSAARPAVEAGWYFSIPPSIVRSRQKQKLARHLPLASLLLETDSPVLGPEPGIRNEPANILVAAKAVAELKRIPVEEVLAAARENSRALYGI